MYDTLNPLAVVVVVVVAAVGKSSVLFRAFSWFSCIPCELAIYIVFAVRPDLLRTLPSTLLCTLSSKFYSFLNMSDDDFWEKEWAKDKRLRLERYGVPDKTTRSVLYDCEPTEWSNLPRVSWPESARPVLPLNVVPNNAISKAALGYLTHMLSLIPTRPQDTGDFLSIPYGTSKALGGLCMQLLSPFQTKHNLDFDTYARIVADCLEAAAVNVLDEDIQVPLPSGSTQRVSGALVGASILREGREWLWG